MDCQKPSIAEKLVPFVEGALADADRREVMEHLPQCQLCTQEVRALREVIGSLREVAGKSLHYVPAVALSGDDVIDYALQAEKMSETTRRRIQLQLVESLEAQQEVEWLRELEQDLQREELIRVPAFPDALKAVVSEVYGAPIPSSRIGVMAWLRGLGPRPVLASLVGVVFASLTVHAAFFSPRASTDGSSGVALGTPAVKSSPAAVAAAAPSATPSEAPSAEATSVATGKDQVALLSGKVLPEDLPALSRRLWDKRVAHSYRDGQIYVAAEDYEQALVALNFNEKRVAPEELKASPVDKGAVAFGERLVGNAAPASAPAAGGKEKARPPEPTQAKAAAASGEGAGRRQAAPAVAVQQPVRATRTAPVAQAEPAPQSQSAARPQPRQVQPPAVAHAVARPQSPAAPSRRSQPPVAASPVKPSGKVQPPPPPRQVLTAQTAVAKSPKPAVPTKGSLAMNDAPVPRRVEPTMEKNRDAQPAPRPASPPKVVEPQAPVPKVVAQPSYNGPRQQQTAYLPAPARPSTNLALKAATREEDARPKDVAVAPTQPAVPNAASFDTKKADEARVSDEVTRRERKDGDLKPVPKWSDRKRKLENTGDGRAGGETMPDERETVMGASRSASSGSMVMRGSVPAAAPPGGARAGTITVGGVPSAAPASEPAEVAMLNQAKKLVIESIGEAEVLLQRRDDGSLMVTVKPQRALNQTETEQLRKALRKKLKLDDADSVVIRQP